ncbi:hypothetical protein ACQWHJ_24350, partial [Salmonella enterica subsp. enterica serovar Infantis]
LSPPKKKKKNHQVKNVYKKIKQEAKKKPLNQNPLKPKPKQTTPGKKKTQGDKKKKTHPKLISFCRNKTKLKQNCVKTPPTKILIWAHKQKCKKNLAPNTVKPQKRG